MNIRPEPPASSRWVRGRHERPGASGMAGQREPAALVVKVGGSLLVRGDWPSLLAEFVGRCVPTPWCLVVGGGPVVEGLRTIDRAAPRPARLMHELAIDAMRLTARLVAEALGLPLSADGSSAATVVLDVPAWIEAGGAATLPAGWAVTSDSIAARVASEHGRGLLLVKSTPPPPCPAGPNVFSTLAAAGWVDEHFPVAAAALDVIHWAAPAART